MTPPTSWSQTMEQTLGYGMTASSGGMTTPKYLLGRCVWTSATSTRDFHLGPVSLEGPDVPVASHNPAVQTSRWEG